MCDGYPPFAMAFVTKDIDTTGYEVAISAVENSPELVNTGRTGAKGPLTLSERLKARIRRLRGL